MLHIAIKLCTLFGCKVVILSILLLCFIDKDIGPLNELNKYLYFSAKLKSEVLL